MRWLVVAALVAAPPGLSGQVARAVEDVDDGVVRFGFATREGVEICDQGIRMNDSRMWWRSDGRDRGPSGCREGSAEVELEVRDGRVREVEIVRSPDERSRSAEDLGRVDADEAVGYFLRLAREARSEDAARDAILPIVIADAPEAWRDLLELAKDRDVRAGVRKGALFWVGQEAASAVTDGLQDVALDEDEDQDVRDAAVFALSQRPADEAIPILIDVASTADHAETRRKAMFWLAQLDDERVAEFFERVLLGRVR